MGENANCRSALYRTLYHHYHRHHSYCNLLLDHLINPVCKRKCGHYFITKSPYKLLEVLFLFFFFFPFTNREPMKMHPVLPPSSSIHICYFLLSLPSTNSRQSFSPRLPHSVLSDCWSLALRYKTAQTSWNIIKPSTFWVSIECIDVYCV